MAFDKHANIPHPFSLPKTATPISLLPKVSNAEILPHSSSSQIGFCSLNFIYTNHIVLLMKNTTINNFFPLSNHLATTCETSHSSTTIPIHILSHKLVWISLKFVKKGSTFCVSSLTGLYPPHAWPPHHHSPHLSRQIKPPLHHRCTQPTTPLNSHVQSISLLLWLLLCAYATSSELPAPPTMLGASPPPRLYCWSASIFLSLRGRA